MLVGSRDLQVPLDGSSYPDSCLLAWEEAVVGSSDDRLCGGSAIPVSSGMAGSHVIFRLRVARYLAAGIWQDSFSTAAEPRRIAGRLDRLRERESVASTRGARGLDGARAGGDSLLRRESRAVSPTRFFLCSDHGLAGRIQHEHLRFIVARDAPSPQRKLLPS